MLAALVLCLAGEAQARWIAMPPRAEIGQPVVLTLEITAPEGSTVLLPDKDPPLDSSWVLLEPRRVERSLRAGELVLDVRWKLCSLEPGARAPWELELPVETPAGRVSLKPAGPALEVRAALGEGEDAPRPPKGFLPLPEEQPSRAWMLFAALAVLVAGGLALWLLRRRRRAPPVAPAGPLEELARLERAFAADPARARETIFELTHLARARGDAARGVVRAALPDEEWLRAFEIDPQAPPAAREPARQLLASAAEVKYALATPTKFAVEEQFARTRALREAYDTQPTAQGVAA